MKITIATKEDILSYLKEIKKVDNAVKAMEVCRIDCEEDIDANSVGIYFDKNDGQLSCYAEDNEVRYNEEPIISYPNLDPNYVLDSIADYIMGIIDTEICNAFLGKKE